MLSPANLLNGASFAKFLFDRPILKDNPHQELLDQDEYFEVPRNRAPALVVCATELFERFAEATRAFPAAQIDQGLWYLLSYPFDLPELLHNPEIASELQIRCMRAMQIPFRDYYAHVWEPYHGTAFFMWWDLVSYERDTPFESAALDALESILALPSKRCQMAALHGLLQSGHARAVSGVEEYFADHWNELSSEDISWMEVVRDGKPLRAG